MRLPRREESLRPFSKLRMSVERPGLRCLGREDDLALAIKGSKHRLDVRLIPSVHEPRNDLQVLLRHRPPSISARSRPRQWRECGYRVAATASATAEPSGLSSASLASRYCCACMREMTSRWTWAVPSKIW